MGAAAMILMKSLFLGRIALHYPGFDQFVEQLLHGIESRKKSPRRHVETEYCLRSGLFAVLLGLERDKIQTNHTAGEMNLTDSVCENLFLNGHFHYPILE